MLSSKLRMHAVRGSDSGLTGQTSVWCHSNETTSSRKIGGSAVETQIGPIGAISPLTQQSEGPLKDMSQQDMW